MSTASPSPPSIASSAVRCPSCGQAGREPNQSFCLRDGTLFDGAFVLGERYRIEELIGKGGTSFVFGARHLILGKSVAVKVLRPEVSRGGVDGQRFVRHARLASQLSHENIVGTIDFGYDASREIDYLVMERVSGPTLAEEIRAAAPFSAHRCASILVQVARALIAAHAHGVVHRDLNPKNIILTETSGRSDFVKLCDFGLSRTFGTDDRVTQTGTFVGTPAYMAPEQMESSGDHGPGVDIYAFGVTAYEMLSGVLPYEGANAVALLANKWREHAAPIHERVPSVNVPRDLEALVLACLDPDPAKRPASAADIERALHDWISAGASRSGISVKQLATATGTQLGVPISFDLIGHTLGSYQIKRQLGAGGVGSVYYAEHTLIGTRAAIKVLLPEMRAFPGIVERFIQEARSAGEIGDPRIAKYFDFGYLLDGRPYAVMEYLEGTTLGARLEVEGSLSVAATVEIMQPVAAALDKAHKLGIIHRDIKPENLFLTDPSTGTNVKVLDFGIAKVISPQATIQTSVGLVAGTLAYAAPEQLFGQGVTAASDVYAFGATLYEMLTGVVPFHDELDNLIMAKSGRTPRPLYELQSSIRADVSRDVLRMLSPQASERPQSMSEVGAMLTTWMQPEEVAHSTSIPATVLSEVPMPRTTTAPLVAIESRWAPDVTDELAAEAPTPANRKRAAGVWLAVAGACLVAVVVVAKLLGSSQPSSTARTHPPPAALRPVAKPAQTPSGSEPVVAASALHAEPPTSASIPAPAGSVPVQAVGSKVSRPNSAAARRPSRVQTKRPAVRFEQQGPLVVDPFAGSP